MQSGEKTPTTTTMPNDDSRLRVIMGQIADACAGAGRAPDTVALLGVSKGQGINAISRLAQQGLTAFGENYVQEALPKLAALAALNLNWHFIGRLQANKTREVATGFAWVHSVDRLKVAERLSAQRPDDRPPLNCCIEINTSGELTKGGIDPSALAELVAAISTLPRLRLRGFMALPALSTDLDTQRAGFRRVRELLAPYRDQLDTLSMGTSEDFGAAIAEGATIVRVGTALFGPRVPRGLVDS